MELIFAYELAWSFDVLVHASLLNDSSFYSHGQFMPGLALELPYNVT